jgi:tetratricopeptide (TPR) repeat protein
MGGGVLAGLLISGVLIWQGSLLAQRWERQQALTAARQALGQREFQTAIARLERTLGRLEPDIEICRLLADACEGVGSREAIRWRDRALRLSSDQAGEALALVRTALALGEPWHAQRALSILSQERTPSVEYRRLAAEVTIASGGPWSEVEAHLAAAAQLEPTNAAVRLALARAQLESTNAAAITAAREQIDVLRAQPEWRLAALRTWLASRSGRTNAGGAELARELAGAAGATFEDRLLVLDYVDRLDATEFDAQLGTLQRVASTNVADTARLMGWLNSHAMAGRTLGWATNLPTAHLESAPVPEVLAQAFVVLGDWDGLEGHASFGNWGDGEPLRLGYWARALRERGERIPANDKARLARLAAQSDTRRVVELARLFQSWNWDREAEELWWLLVRTEVNQYQAYAELERIYYQRRDTQGLHRVAKGRHQLSPEDPGRAAAYALLSLLLSKEAEQARSLMRDEFGRHPRHPDVVVAYAFSRHLQGETLEAAETLNTLTEAQRRAGSRVVYCGVILSAVGRSEEGREYLQLAEQNSELLPEQRLLISAAAKRSPLRGVRGK